jgi:hypothetical protein
MIGAARRACQEEAALEVVTHTPTLQTKCDGYEMTVAIASDNNEWWLWISKETSGKL